MTERDAWIALAATPGVGDLTFSRLLERHGSALAALDAVARLHPGRADRVLAEMVGIRVRPGLARAIRRSADDPRRIARAVAAVGGWALTPLDHTYPAPLRAIEEPPPVLYGLGDPSALSASPLVAVVGTRRPTAVARDLAHRVGQRLAETGVTVVSGLAMGIDGAVHRATLDTGGRAIAVIGSGIDAPGPAPNRALAQRIASTGAVVGELAPSVSATHGTFPRRNRIISGLCRATLVIEAPIRSGALITAHHALEQGRRVLVAPGRPLDPRIGGSLALLRETPARPLVGLDEMIADLELDGAIARRDRGNATPQLTRSAALRLLEPTQRQVAQALSAGPSTVDGLCRATQLDAGVVSAALTMLQLRGWATSHGPTQLPAGPLTRMDNTDGA
jgi:DNA processing protein